MPKEKVKKAFFASASLETAEVLDVHMTAQLLTVSPDTVYDLFKRGELPARKVGRKWISTRSAVLRWIECSSNHGRPTAG